VWDAWTGECRHIFIGHNVAVNTIAYSPRGDQIASGGYDGSVRIWDTEAGKCLWNLTGHSNQVNRIIFSSQGDVVLSASSDMSVRVWDVILGQCRTVIQYFQSGVNDISWVETRGLNYLVAGCEDGAVVVWQMLVDEDHCDLSLKWMTTKGVLDMKDATIQNALGLSQLNRKLLKQRGAVGEPAHRLREASKKVATMASVVSKLKSSSDRALEDSSLSSGVEKELEQKFEVFQQAKDSLFQDVMAVFAKNIHRDE
jgi:hypothetical protein